MDSQPAWIGFCSEPAAFCLKPELCTDKVCFGNDLYCYPILYVGIVETRSSDNAISRFRQYYCSYDYKPLTKRLNTVGGG